MEKFLQLDLQHFAEDKTNEEQGNVETEKVEDGKKMEEDTNTKVEDNGSEDTPLTMEAVQKMIQSENDKIRTEYSKKLREKDSELEDIKKSSMSEQERLDYENQNLQSKLEQQEKDLQEREQAFLHSQLELRTVDTLKEKGLPIEAKNFVVAVDEETTASNIEAFEAMFSQAVKQEIEQRIKGTGKEHNTSARQGSVTKEQFGNMGYAERTELFRTNPTLYKELNK